MTTRNGFGKFFDRKRQANISYNRERESASRHDRKNTRAWFKLMIQASLHPRADVSFRASTHVLFGRGRSKRKKGGWGVDSIQCIKRVKCCWCRFAICVCSACYVPYAVCGGCVCVCVNLFHGSLRRVDRYLSDEAASERGNNNHSGEKDFARRFTFAACEWRWGFAGWLVGWLVAVRISGSPFEEG